MRFFLALGEPVDAPAEEELQMKAPEAGVGGDANIFRMGRG